jgi:hypothetical protein
MPERNPLAGGAMADIYSELRRDHADILDMLYDLAEGGASPERLFPDVYHRVFAHLGAEQDAFYEDLLIAKPTRERALEAFVEHRVIASLLAELAPGDPYDEGWHATLAVMRIMFGRHVADEEGPLFDLAHEALSAVRAEELGGRFTAEKERHLKLAMAQR